MASCSTGIFPGLWGSVHCLGASLNRRWVIHPGSFPDTTQATSNAMGPIHLSKTTIYFWSIESECPACAEGPCGAASVNPPTKHNTLPALSPTTGTRCMDPHLSPVGCSTASAPPHVPSCSNPLADTPASDAAKKRRPGCGAASIDITAGPAPCWLL